MSGSGWLEGNLMRACVGRREDFSLVPGDGDSALFSNVYDTLTIFPTLSSERA